MMQEDSIHIDILVPYTLQKEIAPIFNIDILILIQFTNNEKETLKHWLPLSNKDRKYWLGIVC